MQADGVRRLFDELYLARSDDAMIAVIEQNPELLDGDLDDAIAQLDAEARDQGDEARGQLLVMVRELREMGRSVGVEATLDALRSMAESAADAGTDSAYEAWDAYRATGDLRYLDAAIDVWEKELEETPSGSPGYASALNNVASGRAARYQRTRSADDLERAIETAEQSLVETPLDSPDRVGRLSNWANGLLCRFGGYGRDDDLSRALDALHEALVSVPAGSELRALCLTNYAAALTTRYRHLSEDDDLEALIVAAREAVELTPTGSQDYAERMDTLAQGLDLRYRAHGDPSDLDGAIESWVAAVAGGSPEAPVASDVLFVLARALWRRNRLRPNGPDRLRAIDVASAGLLLSGRTELFQLLGDLLSGGGPVDIAPADDIVLGRAYAQMQGAGAVSEWIELGRLTAALLGAGLEFEDSDDAEDLERAIGLAELVLGHSVLPDTDPRFSSLAAATAAALYLKRWESQRRRADLDRSIAVWPDASRTPHEPLPFDTAGYLTTLARDLLDVYEEQGELRDLKLAVETGESAIEAAQTAEETRWAYARLGTSLRERFERVGTSGDLDRSIQCFERAVAELPADSPELPGLFTNMAIGLDIRYALRGSGADLDRAIELYEWALASEPPDSADSLKMLTNLGVSLANRYRRDGALDDLHRAVATIDRAVRETPADAVDLPARLDNLANVLDDRYERNHSVFDLSRVIQLRERAVEQLGNDSLSLPPFLGNLANATASLYARTGALEDLERAISYAERAVDAVSEDSPDLARFLSGLAATIHDRFEATHDENDADRATELLERSLSLAAPGAPETLGFAHNLAGYLVERFDRLGREPDRDRAIELYRATTAGALAIYPRVAFVAGARWGLWATRRDSWPEASEAFGRSLEATTILFRRQLTRVQKEASLADAPGLALEAANASARAGDVSGAAVALERGRALLLSEALQRDSADLEQLSETGRNDLVDRFRRAAARQAMLERAGLAGTPRLSGRGDRLIPSDSAV